MRQSLFQTLPAAGEKNSEERNQANHSHRLETIPEAIANEQREKIKMGNLDNSFTMMEISIN